MTPVNITLESYNILIGIILFISLSLRHYLLDKVQEWFKWIVLNNMLMAAANIFQLITSGTASPYNHIVFPIAVFCLYLTSFGMVVTCGIEILFFFNLKKKANLIYTALISASVIYLVFLILTPFTGFLYVIHDDNTYSRGVFFFIPYVLQLALYLCLAIYLLSNREDITSVKVFTLATFIFFLLSAQIFQILKPGVYLVTTGYSVAFLAMFVLATHKLEESLDYTEVELDEKANELNKKVTEVERSKLEVIKMQNHTIESLSNLVENRDEDTGEHVRRTRAYVELLAVQLMKNNIYSDILNPRYIRFLKRAAPMHDIGKIVVPDAILKKPGRLTPDEFSQMKRHASEGGRIVHEILDGYEDPQYIQITADIAKHHHEKWNGTGYPDKLKGEAIPLCARIMAIADVFDALVSPRIYKAPLTYEEAFRIIEEESGTHFDPVIAQEFMKIKEKAASINESFKNVDI